MVSQAARKDQLDPDPIETSRPTMEFRWAKHGRTKALQQKHQVWNTRKSDPAPSREEWRDVPMAEDDGGDGADA